MSVYDGLLVLHVAAAFATVASVVLFATLHAATRGGTVSGGDGAPLLALTRLGRRLWDVGGAGTLLLGVWLAVYLDAYEVWDAWIVVALVLWAVAASAGVRVGTAYLAAFDGGREAAEPRAERRPSGALLAVMALAVLALLADMIYKPGA